MGWLEQCSGFQGSGTMIISMFIFWGLLLVLGFYLIKSFVNGNRNTDQDSLAILKNRLAKGEITEEEYDRLKEKL